MIDECIECDECDECDECLIRCEDQNDCNPQSIHIQSIFNIMHATHNEQPQQPQQPPGTKKQTTTSEQCHPYFRDLPTNSGHYSALLHGPAATLSCHPSCALPNYRVSGVGGCCGCWWWWWWVLWILAAVVEYDKRYFWPFVPLRKGSTVQTWPDSVPLVVV